METPTISLSRPRLKRISVILGARETILLGAKGKVTSLPTSSLSVLVAELETEKEKTRKSKCITDNEINTILFPLSLDGRGLG